MQRGLGTTTFLLGALAGVLLSGIAQQLWPVAGGADIEQYTAVRDFAREAFVREVDDEELLDCALHGMLRGLDAYSRFYDHGEAQALERETRGRYRGVGIVFRRPVREGQVLYPLAGSPAARAGVRVGDRFLVVEGSPLKELSEAEFRASMREPQGGVLEARVLGLDGEERELEIVPDSVIDPSVRHVRMLDEERGIAYLAIVSFSNETHQEFEHAFEFLRRRGMQALVLDLRGNFGGVLDSAVIIAQRFIESGVIVSTEGRGEPIVHHAEPDAAWFLGTPLVVLVDSQTASASEVLAGALQDHRAAVLVGEPTYGKGMVQTIRRFEAWGTRAKVTSSYYYSPAGRNFERTAGAGRDHGIRPDLSIALAPKEAERLHARLAAYSPGLEAIGALEAWEARTGLHLIEAPSQDAQLQAALALLRGERPGPHLVQR